MMTIKNFVTLQVMFPIRKRRAVFLRPIWKILFGWLFFSGSIYAMTLEDAMQVWLESTHTGQTWCVQPTVRASIPVNVRYVLESEKSGVSGSVRSSQSGAAQLEAGKAQQLVTLNMNLQPNDRLHLNLKVFEGDKLLSEKTLDLPESAAN
jgi:hypothetical protein